MILGLLFRSPISSIAVGVLWTLILENLLGGLVQSTYKWLPGLNFSAIAEGGNYSISYQRSLFMSAIYIAVGGSIVAVLFKRRDVAN